MNYLVLLRWQITTCIRMAYRCSCFSFLLIIGYFMFQKNPKWLNWNKTIKFIYHSHQMLQNGYNKKQIIIIIIIIIWKYIITVKNKCFVFILGKRNNCRYARNRGWRAKKGGWKDDGIYPKCSCICLCFECFIRWRNSKW